MILGERGSEVLREADAAGLRITFNELSATHRRDLIPRPFVRPLEHGAGTESIYPAGTSNQVIAYGRLKQKFATDYQRIGWELWRRGYSVAEEYWRLPFQHASKTHDYAVRAVIATTENQASGLSETAMAAIEDVSRRRSPTKLFGILRRSVRSGSQTICRIAIQVAAGRFDAIPYFDSAEEKNENFIMGRLLKLETAKKKRKLLRAPSPFNVSVIELIDMLKSISREFAKQGRCKVCVFSEQELRVASNEILTLLNFFAQIAKVEMQNSGRSHPTLALLAAIARDMNVKRHAFLARCWAVVRKIPAVNEGAQRYLDGIRCIAALQSDGIPAAP